MSQPPSTKRSMGQTISIVNAVLALIIVVYFLIRPDVYAAKPIFYAVNLVLALLILVLSLVAWFKK